MPASKKEEHVEEKTSKVNPSLPTTVEVEEEGARSEPEETEQPLEQLGEKQAFSATLGAGQGFFGKSKQNAKPEFPSDDDAFDMEYTDKKNFAPPAPKATSKNTGKGKGMFNFSGMNLAGSSSEGSGDRHSSSHEDEISLPIQNKKAPPKTKGFGLKIDASEPEESTFTLNKPIPQPPSLGKKKATGF